MPARVPDLTFKDVQADLEWLDVPFDASWQEKARALHADNPTRYPICALARFFGKDPSGVGRTLDPEKKNTFAKLKWRAANGARTQREWYERSKKSDPEFMERRAAANRRWRARQKNNKKLGWTNGHWDGI